MKFLIPILLIISLPSCKNDHPNMIDFDLIDVSIYNGWTDYYSFKIYNDSRIYVYNNRYRRGETYFKASLGQKEMDSISNLVRQIKANKPDSLYQQDCQDCGCYNLIIEFNGVKYKSFVSGSFNYDKRVDIMDKLISYLDQIGDNSMKSLDTVFKFESKTKEFNPIPAPPRSPDGMD